MSPQREASRAGTPSDDVRAVVWEAGAIIVAPEVYGPDTRCLAFQPVIYAPTSMTENEAIAVIAGALTAAAPSGGEGTGGVSDKQDINERTAAWGLSGAWIEDDCGDSFVHPDGSEIRCLNGPIDPAADPQRWQQEGTMTTQAAVALTAQIAAGPTAEDPEWIAVPRAGLAALLDMAGRVPWTLATRADASLHAGMTLHLNRTPDGDGEPNHER